MGTSDNKVIIGGVDGGVTFYNESGSNLWFIGGGLHTGTMFMDIGSNSNSVWDGPILPKALKFPSVVYLQNYIFIVGSTDSFSNGTNIYLYHVTNDLWIDLDLPFDGEIAAEKISSAKFGVDGVLMLAFTSKSVSFKLFNVTDMNWVKVDFEFENTFNDGIVFNDDERIIFIGTNLNSSFVYKAIFTVMQDVKFLKDPLC